MAAPCKDCEDRHSNCHSHCSEYKDWTSECQRRRDARRKETEENYFVRDVKSKTRRKKH